MTDTAVPGASKTDTAVAGASKTDTAVAGAAVTGGAIPTAADPLDGLSVATAVTTTGPAATSPLVSATSIPTAVQSATTTLPAALRPIASSIPVTAAAPVAAAAPVTGAVAGVPAVLPGSGLPGSGGGQPLQSPAPWVALALARRLGRTEARTLAVSQPTVPAAAATTGKTTPITWAWGTNQVLAFNPSTDRLDFGWMGPGAFDVAETGGATRIEVVGNNQSYTLQNVPLSQLDMTNIIAKESATVTKWQGLLAGAQTVTDPSVSIADTTVAEGNSGSSSASFTVTLSGPAAKPVTVGYTTVDGSARAGEDYTATSGTVSFAPGVTSAKVDVVVLADTVVEPTETFTVELANPAGASLGAATATATITNDDTAVVVVTPPPAVADRWGTTFYAPYVDMAGWPVPDLAALAQSTGATLFTAAFLQATPEGDLAWAGLPVLAPGSDGEQAQAIDRSIAALQSAGGDVMVSLGGAAGTSLAQHYQSQGRSAQELADAYAGVVDTYRLSHLDFDIEGAAVADRASINLHSEALALVQQAKPDLNVWYTLPVLPTGLTPDGLNVVDSALKAGVNLAGVNVMAMDYGESAAPTSGPNAKTMGEYAIAAAESTYAQLGTLYGRYGKPYGYGQLGVTPMIGVNDVLSEVFTVADAQALEDFARTKGLGMLSMWSVTRDTPGALGQATPTASGLSVPAGSFSGIFNDYGTQNTLKPGTSGGNGGAGTVAPGGTTTTITWSWGTDRVLSFDPTRDKLDFGWFQPNNFTVTEVAGSTQVGIVGNQQSYTLSGVPLSQMRTANIVAKDPATTAKWQSAITAAGQTASSPITPDPVAPPVTPDPVPTPVTPDPVSPPVTPSPVPPPALAVANATVAEGNSGTRNLTFTVSLSSATTTPVTIDYATSNGTATAGEDYTAGSGTLAFAPGVLTQQVNVAVTGDSQVEANETMVLTLSNPDGASLAGATATGTITNDDVAVAPLPQPATALPIAAHDKVLAAYFPEWGIYGRNFQIADIPAEQLTHVIYSFLNVTSNGEVALYDSFAAVDKRFAAHETVSGEADLWYYPAEDPRSQQTVWGNFNQLAQLKEKYPHLKVSIAVGGWTLSGNFSTATSTAAGREKLAESVVTFLETYPMFDGVDFDWEYPGGGGLESNGVSPQDGENYAELLKLVRTKLDVLEQQTGRDYEISVAAPAGYDKIANFNLPGLAPSVDFFNLMSYDFHGTWEKTTGHQSAFTGDANGYDVKTAVDLYLAAGVPANKIVVGAPLYTRGWSGVADGGDGGYLETTTGAAPGSFEAGVYDYKDLLAQLKDPASGWKLYWDDHAQAAYLYNAGKQLFSSFETPTSIAQKSEWSQALGLGGMMFWDVPNDAVGTPDSLIKAAYASWVEDQSMAAVRLGSTLPGERVIGGDGVITAIVDPRAV